MPRSKQLAIATERHSLRLIQQVPAGTPGAYGPDPIFGAYWSRSRAGLNGHGGFVSVENTPTLNDASAMTVLLASVGSDGKSTGDRFYCLAGSIDPSNPSGPRAPYFPGDEWIEMYRGQNELLANGSPVDPHIDGGQGQVSLECLDVLQLLKKTRETAGGFWVNAPRDAFEHYTRLWLNVLGENFANAGSQFPASPGSGSTPDGRWAYTNCSTPAESQVLITGPAVIGSTGLESAFTWPDGAGDHGCWRVEVEITEITMLSGSTDVFAFQVLGAAGPSPGPQITVIGTTAGSAVLQIGDALGVSYPCTSPTVHIPFTLAIEARDRWYLFYGNGQLLGCAPRAALSGDAAKVNLAISRATNSGVARSLIATDQVVIRRTSPPMNGGDPGDYVLASPPQAGGLNGEYFDMTAAVSGGYASALFAAPSFEAIGNSPPQTRLDPTLAFGVASPPAWQMPFIGAFGVRWSGAIYLPLADQDVTFQLPAGYAGHADKMRVWVGRTRAGEEALTNWPGDTPISTSVGMRSLFGSVSGWYPILIEYYWVPTNGSPPWTGTADPGFTYNVGGATIVPPPSVLAPVGLFHQQVRNDSHYDTLRTVADQFIYQFRYKPRQLESSAFPGVIVPRVREGRDTDYVFTESDAISPTLDIKAEDVCSTLLADASGLGGTGAGALSVEAFNFEAMSQHPFLSSELENLPAHTFPPQLLMNLLSLLGYRSAPWEDLQAQSAGIRQMQDTFPLTGVLAEFDWQPGDGVRVQTPSVFVKDRTPRQILTLKRMHYPDGVGENVGSFRPRIRSPEETLRRFVRQVYSARRTFQGQIISAEGAHVDAPTASAVVLPSDLEHVRQATLVVLSKADTTTSYTVEVNGVATSLAITQASRYDIGRYIARNAGEPRMLVALTGGPAGGVTYMIELRVLVPAL